MKRIALILALVLATATSYAQYGGMFHVQDNRPPQHGNQNYQQRPPQHGGIPRHERYRSEVACTEDWQGLWNGNHVRLINGRIYIYDYDGDTVTWGDEVYLLANGSYKVRRNDNWRIYDREGVTTGIWGHEILYWWNGCYCVRVNDIWRVYDADGDHLGVWSREYIELLWNGTYLYIINGRYYVADASGDRISGIWGDRVELMDNGLYRCTRNGRNYFYDERGNERR